MATTDNTDYILSKVVDYLNGHGVTVLMEDLKSHVNKKPKRQHKFVITSDKGTNHKETNHKGTNHKEMNHKETNHKETNHKETNHKGTNHKETNHKGTNHKETNHKETKKKELKFKVKEKEIYNKFIEICVKHNLLYFQFNDEFGWKGPAIKIDPDAFDIEIFSNMDIHILYGFGFGILRPKICENDNSIEYNPINYDECILSDNECSPYNSDNEDILVEDSEKDPESSSESGEEIYTEEWKFDPTNTMYQLDTITNNVYCNQTDSYVGKRIDDFHIDFEAKQD